MANKSTLYFIHGWGMNQAVWQPVTQALTDDFDVVTLDIPGFGAASEEIITPFSLENICQQMEQTIEKPGIFIGWSMGGLIAQYFALHYPALVTGLICVASSPCFAEKKQTDWPGIKPKVLAGFQQQLASDYSKTLERFLAIQAMGSPTAKQDIKALKALLMTYPNPALSALKGGLVLLEQVDLRNQIADITQPTLRIYGRLDSLVPAKAIDFISALQPNAQTLLFKHASHAPFLSDKTEFIASIRQFITKSTNQ
ncbi:pimeloyl-ACP methyl ester esterase BioH [Catenovulum sp. SM1970]|uniref:pimeloyl-ACP methyl ester esterase BioH n=1 Tax=Marinifaba aquimaris TaxID=2741323 RepID=UPI0015738EB3|nr:pimeloyl-ACP methyl ester esterase BioH [Marinifaba aquimaris]NTS75736.1 pimeloyl-ACP methyl ester esterase BioH [Marinifaba aquimaris]